MWVRSRDRSAIGDLGEGSIEVPLGELMYSHFGCTLPAKGEMRIVWEELPAIDVWARASLRLAASSPYTAILAVWCRCRGENLFGVRAPEIPPRCHASTAVMAGPHPGLSLAFRLATVP